MTDFEHIERMPHGEETEFLKDRKLFALALDRQRELDTRLFVSYEHAQWAAKMIADELNGIFYKDTLSNEVVVLKGDDIFMPIAQAEPSGFVGLQTDKPPENTFVTPPRTGHLHGFTSFVKSQEQGEHYRPVLGYQVDVGWAEIPSFSGSLMAYGPVDSSELEFIKDRKTKDTYEAKSRLLGVGGPSLDKLVFTIDDILSGKKSYEANDLQLIARLLRINLSARANLLEQETKDALLDLVKSKLGLYDDLLFRLEADDVTTTKQPPSSYNNRGNLAVTLPVLGVTFTPYYWLEGDQRHVDSEQDELSLIVLLAGPDKTRQLSSIPFESIHKLEPVLK
jgi:hypothetical protein